MLALPAIEQDYRIWPLGVGFFVSALYRQQDFREWLTQSYGVSLTVAGDVISRCRRVERLTALELQQAVRRKKSFDALIEALDDSIRAISNISRKRARLAASHRYAVRLYARFLANSRTQEHSTPYRYRSSWE
jgi:hypothetical protein